MITISSTKTFLVKITDDHFSSTIQKKDRYNGQIKNPYDYWRTNGKHLYSRQVAVLIIAQVGRKSRMILALLFYFLTPIHLCDPFLFFLRAFLSFISFVF